MPFTLAKNSSKILKFYPKVYQLGSETLLKKSYYLPEYNKLKESRNNSDYREESDELRS